MIWGHHHFWKHPYIWAKIHSENFTSPKWSLSKTHTFHEFLTYPTLENLRKKILHSKFAVYGKGMAIRLYKFPKKVSLGPPLSPRVHAEKSGYSDKLQLHVSFVVAWACRSGNTPLKPANEKPSSSQWNDQTSVSHVHIYTYMYICVYRQENIPEERKCDSTKTIPKNH